MRHNASSQQRILALDPASREFGFAVLEGPETLVDWGGKVTRGDKRVETLRKVTDLIGQYRPEAIVVEEGEGRGSRRCPRVQELINALRALAVQHKVRTASFSRTNIRQAFAAHGVVTKHEIAVIIAGHFPELASLLPPLRKPWMSEDHRMHIFDAVSLALTFFHSKRSRMTVPTDESHRTQ
jgi:Holliday junction resolvasome RuvABC endonuclease subunit